MVSGSLQPEGNGNRIELHCNSRQKKDIFHTTTQNHHCTVTEGKSDNGCEEIDSCKDPEPDRCKQMHDVTYTKTLPAEVFISSQARSVLKPIFSISQGGEKPIRKFPTLALAMDLPGFRLPNPSEGLQGLIVTLWQATCMSMKRGPCQDSIPFLLPVCLLSGPASLRINS